MLKFRHVGLETGQLTDEELRYIDKEIITSVYPVLRAREIFPIRSLPNAGIRSIRHYVETDMGQAIITLNGEELTLDRTELAAGTDVIVPVISKDFVLNWRDILAARHNNMPLDLFEGKNAARQVAEEEDKLCITGEHTTWRALGIKGLAESAGCTEASAGAWPTNAVTDVNDAIDELEKAGFNNGPYVLIAKGSWVRKLHAAYSTTGMTYYNFLLQNKILDGIVSSESLFSTDGTTNDNALVVVPSPENFELCIAQDVTVHNAQLPNMNQLFRVYEVVVPHIRRTTSICEITGLT